MLTCAALAAVPAGVGRRGHLAAGEGGLVSAHARLCCCSHCCLNFSITILPCNHVQACLTADEDFPAFILNTFRGRYKAGSGFFCMLRGTGSLPGRAVPREHTTLLVAACVRSCIQRTSPPAAA